MTVLHHKPDAFLQQVADFAPTIYHFPNKSKSRQFDGSAPQGRSLEGGTTKA